MRRGLGRLYDGVIDAGKAVMAAAKDGLARGRPGERGMARFQGPYGTGSYGAPLLSKQEQVLHFKGWTYRCIDYICSRVANEPPSAVRAVKPAEKADHDLRAKAFLAGTGSAPTPRSFVPAAWRQKAVGPAKPDEEYEFLGADDPLARLLVDPNDPETGVGLWYEAELFNCLCGEDFIWVVEDGAGRPSELWVIPSHWVRPVCEGKERLADYFEVGPRGTSGSVVKLDPEQIIWHKKPHPLSKLLAASPTQAAAHVTDQYEMTEAARSAALHNAAVIGGVFQVPAEVQLDDKAVDRLESRFAANHRGVFNAGRPLILESGMAWVPPPPDQELAYMQSQDQLRKFVMSHWGLDEVVLGFASVANRAAMVAAIANVNEATINPRRKGRAAVLTEKLGRRFYPDARIFWVDDTPLDPDSRRQDFQVGGALGAVAPNDYRTHVLALEPFPEEKYDRPTAAPGPRGGPRPVPGGTDDGTRPGTQAGGVGADADRSPGKEKGLVNRVAGLVTAGSRHENGCPSGNRSHDLVWAAAKVRDDGGHEHRPAGPGGSPLDLQPPPDAAGAEKRFDPSEPRDEHGEWTAGADRRGGSKPAPRPPSKHLSVARGLVNVARRRRVIKAVKNEGELAGAIKGFNLPDSEPADVVHVSGVFTEPGRTFASSAEVRQFLRNRERLVKAWKDPRTPDAERERLGQVLEHAQPLHFFEVKTLLTSKAGAVRMSAAARARKERWVARYHAHFHLVAVDDRKGSKHSGHRVHVLADHLAGTTHIAQMHKADSVAAVLDHACGRAGA